MILKTEAHLKNIKTSLQPFAPLARIRITASLTTGPEWHLKFELDDPVGLVLDSLRPGKWQTWERADQLWRTTCFEAFWGVVGDQQYWELNLSPSREQWNLYHFQSYREPQPPVRSNDFELTNIVATNESISCVLRPKIDLTEVEVSLAAVIRTEGQTHYFAAQHAGTKPDFHLRKSFS